MKNKKSKTFYILLKKIKGHKLEKTRLDIKFRLV